MSLDVLNRCENLNYLLLGTEAWVYYHPLLTAVPLDLPETLPYGVIHSAKPLEPVRKFLKIVDFVNFEYGESELW